MAIITLKTQHIARTISHTGGLYAPQLLADMIEAETPVYEMAGRLACEPRSLQALLDGPEPSTERPLNWTGSAAVGVAPFTPAQYVGVTPIPYAGIEGGFTFGPAVFPSVIGPQAGLSYDLDQSV